MKKSQVGLWMVALGVVCQGLLVGCAVFESSSGKMQRIAAKSEADRELARKKNQTGLRHLRKRVFNKAEVDFHEAIAADPNFGPAHNNLGKLYLLERKHYLAAGEFDQAIQCMPNRFEPHLNLGLVYENVEMYGAAEEHYRDAYELAPDVPDVIAHFARVRVKQQFFDGETKELLQSLVFHDNRIEWTSWAKELLGVHRFDGVHSSQAIGSPYPGNPYNIDPNMAPDAPFGGAPGMNMPALNIPGPTPSLPGTMPQPFQLYVPETLPMPRNGAPIQGRPGDGNPVEGNAAPRNAPLQIADPIQVTRRNQEPIVPPWVAPPSDAPPRIVELPAANSGVIPAGYFQNDNATQVPRQQPPQLPNGGFQP